MLEGWAADRVRADLAELGTDPRIDTSRGLVDAADLLERAQIGRYIGPGGRTLHFAVQAGYRADELVIVAARGGDGNAPLADAFLTELEALLSSRRFRLITIETKRRGLVQLLIERGYQVDCQILRKELAQ